MSFLEYTPKSACVAALRLCAAPTQALCFATATRRLQNRRRYRKHRVGPALLPLQSPNRREVRVQSLRDLRRMFDLSSTSSSSGEEGAAAPAFGLARRAVLDDSTTVIPQERRRPGALSLRGARQGDPAPGPRSTSSVPAKCSSEGWGKERRRARAPPPPPQGKDPRHGRRPIAMLPANAAPKRVRPASRLPASLRAPQPRAGVQSGRRVHFAAMVEEFEFLPNRTLSSSASDLGGVRGSGDDAGGEALTEGRPRPVGAAAPAGAPDDLRPGSDSHTEHSTGGAEAGSDDCHLLSTAASPLYGPNAVDRLLEDIDTLCVSDEGDGAAGPGADTAGLCIDDKAAVRVGDSDSDSRGSAGADHALAVAPADPVHVLASVSAAQGKRPLERHARQRGRVKRRPTPARGHGTLRPRNGASASQHPTSSSDSDSVLGLDSDSDSEPFGEGLQARSGGGGDMSGGDRPTHILLTASENPAPLHPDFDFEEEEEEEEEVDYAWTSSRGGTMGDSRDWGSRIFAPSQGIPAEGVAAPSRGAESPCPPREEHSGGQDTECLHFGPDGRLKVFRLAELRARAGKCVEPLQRGSHP